MSDTSPQLIERVKKLLAVANNEGATEAEAEAAMGRVQHLLAQHNLTLAQIENDAKAGPAQRDRVELKGKAAYQYQRDLMAAVADANFCLHWIDYDSKQVTNAYGDVIRYAKIHKHMIVGRQVNVIAAQNMFDYLNATLERLVPVSSNRERLSKFAVSWKEGATARLRSRLHTRKWEMIREDRRKRDEAQARQPAGDGTAVAIRLENVYERESDANWEFRWGFPPGYLAQRRAEWTAEQAAKEPEPQKEETPDEKTKREKRQRKYEERTQREYQRKWASKDQRAYLAGMEVGETIGLDEQIAKDNKENKRIK